MTYRQKYGGSGTIYRGKYKMTPLTPADSGALTTHPIPCAPLSRTFHSSSGSVPRAGPLPMLCSRACPVSPEKQLGFTAPIH
jgi:hypothetical protein